jgi:Txe/YoeB family toxin of Txe-Axe toxin-antitoxin module
VGELFSSAESLSMAYEYKVNNDQKMLKKSNEILKKRSRNAVLRRLGDHFA